MQRFKRLATAALATAMLAGCGYQGLSSASPAADDLGLTGAPYAVQDSLPAHGPMGGMMAAHMGLTNDQQTQLKALFTKHQAQMASASLQAHGTLKALLLADPVDAAAVRAFFTEHQQHLASQLDAMIAALKEARAILTTDQLNRIAALIGRGHPGMARRHAGKGPFGDALWADLELSPPQKQALETLKAKVQGLQAHHAEFQAAAIAFVKTGDGDALKAALTGAHLTPPVEEVIQVAQSLSLAQRQKLVAHLEQAAKPPFPWMRHPAQTPAASASL